jgi:hypothetical protein
MHVSTNYFLPIDVNQRIAKIVFLFFKHSFLLACILQCAMTRRAMALSVQGIGASGGTRSMRT